MDRLAKSEALQEAEFISLFYGEDVTEEQAGKAAERFTAACPNAEVSVMPGGQPVYYYMISANERSGERRPGLGLRFAV